jgi:hypothetical protein
LQVEEAGGEKLRSVRIQVSRSQSQSRRLSNRR